MTTSDIYQSTSLERLQTLLTRIVSRAPMLQERAERAVVILAAGRIRSTGATTFEAMGCGEHPYVVNVEPHSCTCPDFAIRAPEYAGRKWCKHLIAAAMLLMLASAPQRKPGRSRPRRIRIYRPRTRRPIRRRAA